MTAIENCIREAVEKGGHRNGTWKFEGGHGSLLLAPLFWQALGKAKRWKRDFCRHCEQLSGWEHDEGQVRCLGCGAAAVRYGQKQWLYQWHRFIDHLAEGKDAESFFSSLN